MWQTFKKYGKVLEIHCPEKRGKDGRRLGFVRFQDIRDESDLEQQLNQIWIGNWKLRANRPRFQRGEKDKGRRIEQQDNGHRIELERKNATREARTYVDVLKGDDERDKKQATKTPCSEDQKEEEEEESWVVNSDFGEIQVVADVKDVHNEDDEVAVKDWIEEQQSVIQILKQIHGSINVTSKSDDGQSEGQQIIQIEKVNREKSVEMEVDSFKIVNEKIGNENNGENSSLEDARMIGGSNEMVEHSNSNQKVKKKITSNESEEQIQKIHRPDKHMDRGEQKKRNGENSFYLIQTNGLMGSSLGPREEGRTNNAEGEVSMDVGLVNSQDVEDPRKVKKKVGFSINESHRDEELMEFWKGMESESESIREWMGRSERKMKKRNKRRSKSCASVYNNSTALESIVVGFKGKGKSAMLKMYKEQKVRFEPGPNREVVDDSIEDNGIQNCNRSNVMGLNRKGAKEMWEFAKSIGVTARRSEDELVQKLGKLEARDREAGKKEERQGAKGVAQGTSLPS
ncbi:hypothetical protein SLEP1_g32437 [Rubroshorea leprosula]|uniref:RRM domain-containing protein n=1 Tax=Rubroshorea leprosula TaxID=152421 RepID=A0AAV5KD98_9ROSI|nr:hypothetical protein SLEP1_g32437 [Rubroshorea leprosula]